MNRIHIACLVLLSAICLLSLAPAARAQDDRDNNASTAWQIKTKITGKDLSTLCATQNLRIVDINLAQNLGKKTSTYDAVLVPNTGAFAKTWVFQWGVTPTAMGTYANDNGLRPADVAPYDVAGTVYVAVVYIKNSGVDAASWALAWAGPASSAISSASAGGAYRLIQLKNYTDSGSTYYMALGITKDSRTDLYLPAATAGTIGADSSGYRIVTLIPDTGGTFDAILDTLNVGGYYWYYGEDEEFMFDAGTGTVFRPNSFAPDGTGVFAATFIPG